MDDIKKYEQELEELKSLRERLVAVETTTDTRDDSTEIRKHMLDEINSIDEEIKKIEAAIKESAKAYEQLYKKALEKIEATETYEKTYLETEEEIQKAREKTEQNRLEINEESIVVKKKLNELTKMIGHLKSKKTRLENSIKSAEALGLTYSEYVEINSTLQRKSRWNTILEKKGLSEIIDKSDKERTKEEKAILKQTRKEVLAEISEVVRSNEEGHILDSIIAIYSLDTVTKAEEPRKIKVNENELMVVSQNKSLQLLPHKIVNSNQIINTTYEAAPKDMEGAKRNIKIDFSKLKPLDEKVTIFKDKDADEYYVRKYALNKLELIPLSGEIKINGSSCYKISEKDVAIIEKNGKNSGFPYITDIKEVDLSKNHMLVPEVVTEPQTTPSTEVITEPQTTPSADSTEVVTEPQTTPSADSTEATITREEIEAAIRAKLKGGKDKDDKLKAKNVKASKKFKLELKEGTIAYNIIHKGIKFGKKVIRGIVTAYNNYLFGREMAAKIDKFEREELGRRHFYDDDDELENMMNDKKEPEESKQR